MNIKLPEKPRKHRWVTEALNSGQRILTVWPDEDDLKTEDAKEKFLTTIVKIGSDPRVKSVQKHADDVHYVVYLFHLTDD